MSQKTVLTHEEVLAIAELAKLDLTATEVEEYAAQLSEILNYFTILQQVDISYIEPTASVLPLKNVMRADVASSALSLDEVTANAPAADENQFLVSAVLDDE